MIVSEFVAHALAHVRREAGDPDVDDATRDRCALAEAELLKFETDGRDLTNVELVQAFIAEQPGNPQARKYRDLLAMTETDDADLLDVLMYWCQSGRLYNEGW